MSIDFAHEPDIGYLFYPPSQPHHPGHPRLDIIIPAKPTERHFDPQTAVFQTLLPPETIEETHIHHPWPRQKPMQVIPGRIFIKDRKQKMVEAYSFGGSLTIATEKVQTVCVLQSSAPIFSLFLTQDLVSWLVDEVEVLFAQQRVKWEQVHLHSFEVRLAEFEPLLLYAACLATIKRKFGANTKNYDKTTRQSLKFINDEINQLQNDPHFPSQAPTLDALLN